MKKLILSFLCLCLCLPLGGCWNRREIGNIAIVMGFSVDEGEKKDKIEITAQIANTRTIASANNGKEGSGEKKPYLNLSSSGEYVFPAIRNSVTKSGARLYMAHNYVVIFSEALARQGLSDYMDFFLRDHELRLDTNLLIARGKARDILNVNTGFQSIPALHLHDLVDAQKQLSTGMPVTVMDFMNTLSAKRSAGLVPIIEVERKEDNEVLHMTGTAVFDGGKMIGELSARETRGLLWAKNAVRQAVVMVQMGESRAGIEVLNAGGKLRPRIGEDGRVYMEIEVRATGALASERGEENFTTPEGADTLLAAFSGEIENEIRACLKKAETLHVDVFGFSDAVYRLYPKKWEEMREAPFYALPVTVNVHTRLESTGRIGRPVA